MSYIFYNNWPYDYTVFPTMKDHIDPVNNAYFTGLHSEIANIETELGLNPSGSYPTVKDQLDAHESAINSILPQKMTEIMKTPDEGTPSVTHPPEIVKETYYDSSWWVAKFDPNSDEYLNFVFPVPSRAGTGNLRVTLYGKCNATTGTALILIALSFKANNENIMDWGASAAYKVISMTAQSNANYLIVNTGTVWGSEILEGKIVLLQVYRMATYPEDTLTVDFDLLAIKIEEI